MLKSLQVSRSILVECEGIEDPARAVATEHILRGSVVYRVTDGLALEYPSYVTVQMSESVHVVDVLLAHLNHSCDPSVWIDTTSGAVVALRDIAPGEECTFFYPTTEWQIVRTFLCGCGASRCLGAVRGARFLSARALAPYRPSPHVLRLQGRAVDRAPALPIGAANEPAKAAW